MFNKAILYTEVSLDGRTLQSLAQEATAQLLIAGSEQRRDLWYGNGEVSWSVYQTTGQEAGWPSLCCPWLQPLALASFQVKLRHFAHVAVEWQKRCGQESDICNASILQIGAGAFLLPSVQPTCLAQPQRHSVPNQNRMALHFPSCEPRTDLARTSTKRLASVRSGVDLLQWVNGYISMHSICPWSESPYAIRFHIWTKRVLNDSCAGSSM